MKDILSFRLPPYERYAFVRPPDRTHQMITQPRHSAPLSHSMSSPTWFRDHDTPQLRDPQALQGASLINRQNVSGNIFKVNDTDGVIHRNNKPKFDGGDHGKATTRCDSARLSICTGRSGDLSSDNWFGLGALAGGSQKTRTGLREQCPTRAGAGATSIGCGLFNATTLGAITTLPETNSGAAQS